MIYIPNSFRTMSYLGFISVRSEMQSFLWKKQLNDGNHGQGTAEIPQNLFGRSAKSAKKFGILLKKGFIGRP